MDTVAGGKLAFTRLFFRKSRNKKGEDCYISKIKQYDNDPETNKKIFAGDLIIIANVEGLQKCGIDREGRWDVRCRRMSKGTGFVVIDADWTIDHITLQEDGWKLRFLISGKEDKLKTEDGKFIPLGFDCEKYYNPTTIQANIERKFKYLQLPPNFNHTEFFAEFHGRITYLLSEYKEYQKAQGTNDIKQSDLDRLKTKW